MRFRAALWLLPVLTFAQEPPAQAPPEVDQALRARVNEFFQDLVQSKFFEAMNLVADDTKSEYIAQGKTPLQEYQIRGVQYSSGFTKANVDLQVKRIWSFQGQQAVVDVPMKTTWKVEKDKWVWYDDTAQHDWVTPMGASNVTLLHREADGSVTGLPQKLTQETINAAAQKILGQVSGVSKEEVTLAPDKPSTDTVTFHNGTPGSIHLDLYPPQVPGLSVKLSKGDLSFGQDASVELSYQPGQNNGQAPPETTTVYLVVAPFNQEYKFLVRFGAPKK